MGTATMAASSARWCAREGNKGGGELSGEREERGTGRVGGLEGCVALGRGIQRRRRQPGREEVAGAHGRARRARARPPGREEDDKGGSGGGLGRAGPVGLPGERQVSPGGFSLSCFFIFVLFSFYLIFCHCFEFKIIQKMPKAPLEYFYFARWTFPKAHKIFQGYLKLYSSYMNIIQIQIANDLNSKSQK